MWHVVERYNDGWQLLEGAGPRGGDWMARLSYPRACAIFGSRFEAEQFIQIVTEEETS